MCKFWQVVYDNLGLHGSEKVFGTSIINPLSVLHGSFGGMKYDEGKFFAKKAQCTALWAVSSLRTGAAKAVEVSG